FPLENPEHIKHIRENVLNIYLRDNQLAYVMQTDGSYRLKRPLLGEPIVNVQNWLMRMRRK
ncbi:MAG TPA: hypothetical protein VF896_16555, partial [Anaerolineales bacterium]